jgi:anti-sigma-K factor RskA
MPSDDLHQLAAGYALHALDADDQRAFEAHLAGCPQCRDEVASMRDAAAALAYDVDLRAPPETLERRILRQARAERPNVVTLRRRLVVPAAALSAAAAAAAIALAIWATSLSHSLDRERSASRSNARVVAILSQPDATRVPLTGASGALVLSPTRRGVLIVNDLQKASADKTYEAWVVTGKVAKPAGVFRGGDGRSIVELTRSVPRGAVVGVTLERAPGVEEVTGPMLFRARVAAA